MRLSTHYYVLSLGAPTSTLFEAFRGSLIEVENQGFPIPARGTDFSCPDSRRGLARRVDRCFASYYAREPLGVVVVGAASMQDAFGAETLHGAAVIGHLASDHTQTALADLSVLVWPVVKETLSGTRGGALRELKDLAAQGPLASGLNAAARVSGQTTHATLLVEEDFRCPGSLRETSRGPVFSPDLDVRDPMDDIVDAVIERVLQRDGNVVFTPPGSLREFDRVVLLVRSDAPAGTSR